jgi:hypothetical protein
MSPELAEPSVVSWRPAGTAYYAVLAGRVVGVLFQHEAVEGEDPSWVLVDVRNAGVLVPVPLRPFWAAMPGVEALAPATNILHALLTPV